MTLDTVLTHFISINSKWIRYKCKHNAISDSWKITRKILDKLDHDNDFIDKTPKSRPLDNNNWEAGLHTIFIFSVKHGDERMRRQATDWEEIFAKKKISKGLPKYINNSYNS